MLLQNYTLFLILEYIWNLIMEHILKTQMICDLIHLFQIFTMRYDQF